MLSEQKLLIGLVWGKCVHVRAAVDKLAALTQAASITGVPRVIRVTFTELVFIWDETGANDMQLQEVLLSLGVTEQTLSQEEKDKLDRDGFLPLSNILSAQQIAQINQRTEELIVLEGDAAGTEVHQEAGTIRLSDLVNKDPI